APALPAAGGPRPLRLPGRGSGPRAARRALPRPDAVRGRACPLVLRGGGAPGGAAASAGARRLPGDAAHLPRAARRHRPPRLRRVQRPGAPGAAAQTLARRPGPSGALGTDGRPVAGGSLSVANRGPARGGGNWLLPGNCGTIPMRLATVQTDAGPRAAVLQGAHYVDLHATDPQLPAGVRALLEAGPEALRRADEAARRPGAARIPAAGAKLFAPVP